MRHLPLPLACAALMLFVLLPHVSYTQQKKILYIASYHTAKEEWSAGIKAGIESTLASRSDIILKTHDMDTRLAKSEDEKKQAALLAKQVIESWRPDVVITSDDNAAKYLIQPYYQGAALPFVFCGLNWDATIYDLPYSNTTGMVEVQLIRELIDHLTPYARGNRVGTLRGDTLSNRKEQVHFEKHVGFGMESRYVTNIKQWKEKFIKLQDEVDLLILGSIRALETEHIPMGELAKFVQENAKIPLGAYDEFMKEIALVTLSTIPEEQGQWAAGQALKILAGTPPSEIAIVKNKKATRHLNMKIARRLGIRFPIEMLEASHLVSGSNRRVLFINSYHQGYHWSDNIEKGLVKALGLSPGPGDTFSNEEHQIDLKIFRMDTKNRNEKKQIEAAAQKARQLIEEWDPDIVIASDDNASKFVIQPYYLDASLPVVFCGVNYDAGVYNFPANNITGMVEIEHLDATITILKNYARGNRVGYLGSDDMSNRKSLESHRKMLKIHYDDGSLVSTFDEWKREYIRLQSTVDMLIIINAVGIRGWDPEEVDSFVLEHTSIPTGAIGDSEIRFALLGNVKIAEEQGWWAGTTAIKIIDGAAPSSIPITRNQRSRLYVNMPIAKALGITFPVTLLEQATMFGQDDSSE